MATSIPLIIAPPTLLVKERWKLSQVWSTGQTAAGRTMLYCLTRKVLFTKARSAYFHSFYTVAFSKPELGGWTARGPAAAGRACSAAVSPGLTQLLGDSTITACSGRRQPLPDHDRRQDRDLHCTRHCSSTNGWTQATAQRHLH